MKKSFAIKLILTGALFSIATFATMAKIDASRAAVAKTSHEFPISFWCGPPEEFLTRARFQEIKDAGFTHAMPPCGGPDTPQYNRKTLEFCRQVGLKAYIADGRLTSAINAPDAKEKLDALVEDYKSYPALAGYFLGDEPSATAFPGLAKVVDYLREKDPQHPVFVNLLPNYASPEQLGTATYEEYLSRFLREVKPFLLSYDHYFFVVGGADGALFFPNLAAARKASLESKTPFQQIVQSTEFGSQRRPNEGELRYEAMQTLAYGGQSLMWFTYWQPTKDKSFEWKHSMIDGDGVRDEQYYLVKKVNRELRVLGAPLLGATSLSVFHDGKVQPGGALHTDEPIRVAGKGDFTIGTFRGADGKTLVLITNADYKNEVTSDFQVSAGRKKVQLLNASTRAWNYVSGAAARGDGNITISLKLSPGGAALLRW